MAGRGVKEGNNALNKVNNCLDLLFVLILLFFFLFEDDMGAFTTYNGREIVEYAIENNCSREIYDLLLSEFPQAVNNIFRQYSSFNKNISLA